MRPNQHLRTLGEEENCQLDRRCHGRGTFKITKKMHSDIPMREARGGDELAQLLHPICNIRASEIKIEEPINKAVVALWLIKEKAVISCKLGTRRQKSRGGVSNSHTSITNQIDNVFVLAEIHATRVTGNLNTKKKMGMTKVLDGKKQSLRRT